MRLEKRTIIILASIGMLSIGALLWLDHVASPPRDAKVLARFRKHKDDFERLRKLMQTDGRLGEVAGWVDRKETYYWSSKTEGSSEKRYEEYESLINALDVSP